MIALTKNKWVRLVLFFLGAILAASSKWLPQLWEILGISTDSTAAVDVTHWVGIAKMLYSALQSESLGAKENSDTIKLIIAIAIGGMLFFSSPPDANAFEIHTKTATIGFAPSIALAPMVVELGGQSGLHLLPLGAGGGVTYSRMVGPNLMRLGLYGAPELTLGDGSEFKLALFTHLVLWDGYGIGFGWHAFEVGGPQPGIHPFHRSHLFVFAGYELEL